MIDTSLAETLETMRGIILAAGKGSRLNGTAGQAKLVYTAASNSTLFQLDVNGDNKVDYQLRLNGDQSGNTHIATGADDLAGGWYLYGGAPT